MPIVLGYHGCSQDAAQQLLSGVPFMESNKPYDWLGSGIYFWENDPLRAYEWAKERRSAAPCVVGAAIELGHCLDLTTRPGIEAIRSAFRAYSIMQSLNGQPLPVNQSSLGEKNRDRVLRYLDRAVVNHLHASFERSGTQPFDTVRALLPEGSEAYPGAGFLAKTHVQIAVRQERQILGVFRVPASQIEDLKIPRLYDF